MADAGKLVAKALKQSIEVILPHFDKIFSSESNSINMEKAPGIVKQWLTEMSILTRLNHNSSIWMNWKQAYYRSQQQKSSR
jgi:hypothetical protein